MNNQVREIIRIMKRVLLVFVFALSLAFLVMSAAQAQDNPPSDDDVNAIAKQLYCPVCENIPLDVCGTQACAQWRDLIREKLAEGWSDSQIKQYFVAQYGDRVLATPPAHGLNWLVYIVPPLAILAGAVILVRALRMWRGQIPSAVSDGIQSNNNVPMAAEQDEYIKRLEEELNEHSM